MIPKSSGVYVITNTVTKRIYIGQTRNLARRASMHWATLRKGTHHNTRLQADWDEYGERAFGFAVRTLAPADEACRLERDLIAEHMGDACYNWSPAGSTGRPCLPDEIRGVARSIRLTPEDWRAFDSLGIKWLKAELLTTGSV